MSGIAGIMQPGKSEHVKKMLNKILHRGKAGSKITELNGATLGIAWTKSQFDAVKNLEEKKTLEDSSGDGHYARALLADNGITLKRDELGVAPLYYGRTNDGALCFASEVKAMLEITDKITQLPAGQSYNGTKTETHFKLEKKEPIKDSPETIAKELRRRLDASVKKRVKGEIIGSWLSGGLDSSTLAAIARKNVKTLHTFVAGVKGASDIENARAVADFIKSEHHELVVSLEEMIAALPKVIYHLESFDALLVRSSIINYLVAKAASDYVPEVFSGESGDELFAGYDYLKSLDLTQLPDELIDITNRLQNTAFQRVDRSASAHGTVAHIVFADPDVVDYAVRIPVEFKIRDGIEKWILRRAMDGDLPKSILTRTKAKFWEGAGVLNLLEQYANSKITDSDFTNEKKLINGWTINSKEELMYYRIFKGHFGDLADLSWMGRTKSAPK